MEFSTNIIRPTMKQETAIDRLSELSEPLIYHILSLLDNMKDAVKTSALSKSWKYSWTNVDTIVYDFNIVKEPCVYSDTDIEKRQQQFQEFMLFVDRTLMQCSCPKIKKLSLTASDPHVYKPFPMINKLLVDKWIRFVLDKNVEVLNLGLEGLDYIAPQFFYRNSSLLRLEINEMGKEYSYIYNFSLSRLTQKGRNDFYHPYYYEKTFDVCWNKLKSLSLRCVYVKNQFMSEILSGCPALETLTLDDVEGLSILHITSPKVSELKLSNFGINCDDSKYLEITAPWNTRLEVMEAFDCFECNLVDVSSLKYANLTFNYLSWSDDRPCEAVWHNMINYLLKPTCKVEELVVGEELLQALSLSKLLGVPSPTMMCRELIIHSPICVHEVPGIIGLLETSPYLETLVIKMMPWMCQFSRYLIEGDRYIVYMKEVFSSLPHGADYLSQQTGKFPSMKKLKIDCTKKEYSDIDNLSSKNNCFEFETAAHIVRNAPALEKFVLVSSSNSSCTDHCAARYTRRLSSRDEVGDKASHWELKETKSGTKCTYEFRIVL